MRGYLVSAFAALLVVGAGSGALADEVASILVCDLAGSADGGDAGGPTVAYYERSVEELAACDSSHPPAFCAAVEEIERGMSCASALAALDRSAPFSTRTASAQRSKPLIIVAEDIEGEAISTSRPIQPQSDVLFGLGEDGSVLVGCDLFSRRDGTLTMFDQTSGDDDGTVASFDAPATSQSCAQKLTLFLNDGVPLRSSTGVLPSFTTSIPNFAASGSAPLDRERVFDPEISVQVSRRYSPPYYVKTVTHRF